MIKVCDKNIYIRSKDNCVILTLNNGELPVLAWHGKAINQGSDFSRLRSPGDAGHASTDNYDCKNAIISFTANGNDDNPFVIIGESDGNFSHRFCYVGAQILESPHALKGLPHARDKEQTVKLCYKAEGRNIYLNQYISTFSDCSVIAFSSELLNGESKPIYVKRLMSFQCDFHAKQCEITTLRGAWGRERKINAINLSAGTFVNETRQGFSSNQTNPYISVKTERGVLGLNLVWSGNHKQIINLDEMQKLRILSGINDYCLDYEVAPNQSFVSPEAVAVWGGDQTEVTREMHEFANKHIINPNFALKQRPILINNWEATYFDFDHEKLLNIAKLAKDAGIELFVLDDGWFGSRDNDQRGLGDWVDNQKKTGGLALLKQKLNKMGMKFGLWVEPEMVNPDSDLYRAHPEYAMQVPGVNALTRRHQLILDLANPAVCEYLYNSINSIIKRVKPDYIKWDCNRYFIDVYSPALKNQGNYFYDYMVGFYNLLSRLVYENSEVLFEGCSSGGNRFDLGALYYTPQIWASDNTDASHRLFIQEGTFTAYPQSTAGCHVSISPNHQSQSSTSIETRFNVACFGAFGYEYDLTKCSEQDLCAIKNQVAFYKEYRELLQTGNMYLSGGYDQNKGVWTVVNSDKSKAIALIYRVHDRVNYPVETFSFLGLDENALYEVSMREQNNCKPFKSFIAYGDMLMRTGVNMGNLFYEEWDRKQNSNAIATRLVIFSKI